MVFIAWRTSLLGLQNATSLLIISPTDISAGLRFAVPRATNKSRSVTIPTTRPFSTMGRLPQFLVNIISATEAAFVPGLQEQTSLVIISSTRMASPYTLGLVDVGFFLSWSVAMSRV